MKKVRSAKKSLIRYFFILLIITLLCLILYGVYSIWTFEQQMIFSNQASLDVYFNNLVYILEDLTLFNQKVYSDDTDFSILSSRADTIPDPQKLVMEYNLRNSIQNRVPDTGAIFIFNKSKSVNFYWYGSNFIGGTVNKASIELMNRIRERLISADQSELMRWQVYSDDSTELLMNAYRLRDMYVCSIIDLNAFISTHTTNTETSEYVFFTNDRILTNIDFTTNEGITLERIKNVDDNIFTNLYAGNIIRSDYYAAFGIGLSGIMSLEEMWSYLKISVTIFLVAIIVICVLFFVIYTFISRILIYPLNQITIASKKLAGSDAEETIPQDQDDLLEYSTIRIALNRLVVQKVNLEQDNIGKTREKEHALLQYYQLQTRSHFFLNCLKSLYNMAEKGEMEKIKMMILAFSNHLRYVFHDNLLLVTLKSELDEAQDYYHIIQMDRANPLLLNLEVDQDLMDCKVPPLVVQTFLENSYKYNPGNKQFLRFHVQIDRIEMEKKPYIRLRLSDNGIGYGKDMLKKLSEPDEQFEEYHVGISNLRRRMALIYQNDYQIAFFNAPGGGACSLIYLPMQKE
ncbi:MAG: sensor histidine kinase [Anaerolineaceae bacterium]